MKRLSALLLAASLWGASSYAGGDSHNQHAAVFTGVTVASGHAGFTLGADYEYMPDAWGKTYGLIGIVDFVLGKPTQSILAVGGTWHPMDALRVVLAPGVEMAGGHSAGLLRIGTNYDFHFDTCSVSPTLNLDIVGGHIATVIGVAFGMGF